MLYNKGNHAQLKRVQPQPSRLQGENGGKIYSTWNPGINSLFSPVACTITNEGEIEVNNSFERGISTLTNSGSIIIQAGGTIGSGMSNTENQGSIVVEQGGELVIDRGSIFNNFGELVVNTGHVLIDNGGQFNDEGGTFANDGVVDVNAYFNGDISKITGTGILNDNRE